MENRPPKHATFNRCAIIAGLILALCSTMAAAHAASVSAGTAPVAGGALVSFPWWTALLLPATVSGVVMPKYATMTDWCQLSGLSRSVTYELIGLGHLKAVKLGARTLIDVEHGLAQIATMPAATVRAPARASAIALSWDRAIRAARGKPIE